MSDKVRSVNSSIQIVEIVGFGRETNVRSQNPFHLHARCVQKTVMIRTKSTRRCSFAEIPWKLIEHVFLKQSIVLCGNVRSRDEMDHNPLRKDVVTSVLQLLRVQHVERAGPTRDQIERRRTGVGPSRFQRNLIGFLTQISNRFQIGRGTGKVFKREKDNIPT